MKGDEEVVDAFKDGKWDKAKMIRSFARLGATSKSKLKEKTEVSNVYIYLAEYLLTLSLS